MKAATKREKENIILLAAENVFSFWGYSNAKMEMIASEAGITKVTLYSYFQSKENLYMALTYKALCALKEKYEESFQNYSDHNGLEATLDLIRSFMSFCEENFLFSELLLDYFSLVRSTSQGRDRKKLTVGMKESEYYNKIQEIHNFPFKQVTAEIERGKEDGSIAAHIDSMLMTLSGWTICIGFAKVIAASGSNATPIFNVSIKNLKKYKLKLVKDVLEGQYH